MQSKIYLIRHGITEGNLKHWYYGATDIPLTEDGKAALRAFAAEGVYPPFQGLLLTSGLLRTEQTAEEIYGPRQHAVIEALRENNFGAFECKNHEELLAEPEYRNWLDSFADQDYVIGGGESWNQFRSRIQQGWEQLLSLHLQHCHEVAKDGEGGEIPETIMICHGGVISALLNILFPTEGKNMYDWCPEPGLGYALLLDMAHVTGYERLHSQRENE